MWSTLSVILNLASTRTFRQKPSIYPIRFVSFIPFACFEVFLITLYASGMRVVGPRSPHGDFALSKVRELYLNRSKYFCIATLSLFYDYMRCHSIRRRITIYDSKYTHIISQSLAQETLRKLERRHDAEPYPFPSNLHV